MEIAADIHFSNLKDGLYTNMGGEGRWACSWAKLLAENGQHVDCICSENVYGWGSSPPIPNINFVNRLENRTDEDNTYDIALLPGPEIPRGIKADLYIYNHFSPCTIVSSDHLGLYRSDNSIIVYPFETNFRYITNPPNRYEYKTYAMPTPIAENMQSPDFNRQPSVAWTSRWGPTTSGDIYFNSMVKFARIHNLRTRIFSYQNFFVHLQENESRGVEYKDGVRIVREKLDSLRMLQPIEEIPSIPVNQLMDKLKVTKFSLSTHGGGLGGSMLEQVASGACPLPGTGTYYTFPHVDSKFYDVPYPQTIDGIVKNWEMPLNDESFYVSIIKAYQKAIEPHLYSNCLNQFSKIISKFGFKL